MSHSKPCLSIYLSRSICDFSCQTPVVKVSAAEITRTIFTNLKPPFPIEFPQHHVKYPPDIGTTEFYIIMRKVIPRSILAQSILFYFYIFFISVDVGKYIDIKLYHQPALNMEVVD